MPIYRAFPHRYFIAVHWVDVEADSQKKASKLILKAVNKLFPKEVARADAVDNTWSLDSQPMQIERNGQHSSNQKNPMRPIYEDKDGKVFMNEYDANRLDLRLRSGWDTNNLVLVEEAQLRQAIDFCKKLIANPNISVQVKTDAADLIETLLKDPEIGGA